MKENLIENYAKFYKEILKTEKFGGYEGAGISASTMAVAALKDQQDNLRHQEMKTLIKNLTSRIAVRGL